MKQIPIGERLVITTCLIVLAYIIGVVCWDCLAEKLRAKEQAVWQQQEAAAAVTPTPTPTPEPLYRLFIGFNHESQVKDMAQQTPKDGNYELLFYYSEEKGKAWQDPPTGALVKCEFRAEYAQALINKDYYGELEINSNQCRRLHP